MASAAVRRHSGKCGANRVGQHSMAAVQQFSAARWALSARHVHVPAAAAAATSGGTAAKKLLVSRRNSPAGPRNAPTSSDAPPCDATMGRSSPHAFRYVPHNAPSISQPGPPVMKFRARSHVRAPRGPNAGTTASCVLLRSSAIPAAILRNARRVRTPPGPPSLTISLRWRRAQSTSLTALAHRTLMAGARSRDSDTDARSDSSVGQRDG
mmetsp:Transcript_26976/g.79702  ORF Transcript_26976/g.79702 Transcript_26976/m.79702 type:complete len:210 (-) Transcript_26976:1054-1683(-)